MTYNNNRIRSGVAACLALWLIVTVVVAAEMPAELADRVAEVRSAAIEVPSGTAAEQLIARAVVQIALTQHYNRMTFTPINGSRTTLKCWIRPRISSGRVT